MHISSILTGRTQTRPRQHVKYAWQESQKSETQTPSQLFRNSNYMQKRVKSWIIQTSIAIARWME